MDTFHIIQKKGFEVMKDNKDLLLNNSLVAAKKNLKVYEAKIFYTMLEKYTYELRQNNKDDRTVIVDSIDIKEIMLGGKTNISFERYKERLESMKQFITLEYNPDDQSAHMIAIISEIKIEADKTIIKLSYDLCERLLLPENKFTPLKLIEISKLTSGFSIKAYELISIYRNLDSGVYRMPVDKFNWYFDIKDSYRAHDIDRRVIKPILEEINANTRFNLRIEKVKKRNKITHYDFYINEAGASRPEDKPVKQIEATATRKETTKEKDTTTSNDIQDNFERLWSKYPSKIGKAKVSAKDKRIIYKLGEEADRCLERYIAGKPDWRSYQDGSRFFHTGYIDYTDKENSLKQVATANKSIYKSLKGGS